jgi:two-component system response regulator MprA
VGNTLADLNRVLIVEDDPFIVDFLKLGFGHEGFEVHVAADGKAGLDLFHEHQPDLVILDLNLPSLDGREVCKRLRAQADVPILVLTASDQLSDKLNLFNLGADDYIVKPFNFDELLARIRAVMRRHGKTKEAVEIKFLDLELRLDTREVLRGGVAIELSAKEFDLLHFFMSNPRRVLTKETILNQVWGYEYMGDSNIVEVYVGHLRRKLGEPSIVQTVRGVGYSLRA